MDDLNELSNIIQWILRYFPPTSTSISNKLRHELLNNDDDDDEEDESTINLDDFSNIDLNVLNTCFNSDKNDTNNENNNKNKMKMKKKDIDCLFYGVPRRPLYREVAYRLLLWNQHQLYQQHYQNITTDPPSPSPPPTTSTKVPPLLPLLVPAEHFGFHEEIAALEEEEEYSLLRHPPPDMIMMKKKNNNKLINFNYISKILQLRSWLSRVGDNGITRLLGMRRTIGTTDNNNNNNKAAVTSRITTPSRKQLLHAACQPYHHQTTTSTTTSNNNNPLTVAARARTKHAHRCRSSGADGGTEGGGGGYFGTIKGNATYQNQITKEILVTMIQDATWINIHTFSGRDYEIDGPVVEIRVSEGYGARWQTVKRAATTTAIPTTTSNSNTSLVLLPQQRKQTEYNENEQPTILQFRGFLEPQMEDGHEKKWRH